ncbi:gag-pol polyprotein [Tanacetum coccineum]
MSSECNNIKLAIRNDKSEVVCAMCKQFLITANHDVRVLNYVNDGNSCGDKHNANASKIANQKKHKPKVKKPKKAEAIATACYTQNRFIIHCRFNKTSYELINYKKTDISFLHVFGAHCYPKNDRKDIGKLGAKGDTGFFIGYSATSCAYRVYNRRKKKIIETMNVTFDELSAMAFEQCNIPNTSHDVDELQQQQHVQQQLQPEAVAENVPNAMFDGNTFVNPFAPSSLSAAESSSSHYVDPSNMHTGLPHSWQRFATFASGFVIILGRGLPHSWQRFATFSSGLVIILGRVPNPGTQIVENMNGLSVVLKITNQYGNGNGNVVTAPTEGNGNGINEEEAGIQSTQKEFEFIAAADAHEETKRVKVNCTLEDTLQQASTSRTQSDNAPVYDSDRSTEVPKDEDCYDHDIFNMPTQEVQYIDLQTELDRTKQKLETCIIKKEKEYNTLWNNWYKKCEECKYDKISYDKAYNDMQTKIERLQAQLGDLKVLPKVDKTNALSKPVTSNSAPSTRESKVVQTINVIALRFFRTNPSKTSRVDNVVPNKPVKISDRIKLIIVSQLNVIHKQQANSDSNGFSSTRVNNTSKTRRPHTRNNSNTNWVPSKSKSSCLSNNVEKIEENHKNS